jgi:hypothetical protein
MKTSEEFLNDKFNGKGYEFKIHDWINGQVSNYPPCELLEEYAQQNTLNRDKVMEILTSKAMSSLDEIVDAICSLSLPALSEGEIHKKAIEAAKEMFVPYRPGSVDQATYRVGYKDGFNAALKELTKPKEE